MLSPVMACVVIMTEYIAEVTEGQIRLFLGIVDIICMLIK